MIQNQLINKKISIVIPAFNEEGNIEILIQHLHQTLKPLQYNYEIIFVDDGSVDKTISILKEISQTDDKIFYIEFSKNFGHQYALKAGLDYSTGDAVISMDADMQHPPHLIANLIKEWENGFDIIYTKRLEDKKLPAFKRFTSTSFYKIINSLSELNIEIGAADFRLMDRKVVDVFKDFTENELFLRGLINWVGFKQKGIEYLPNERFSGTSKYTIKKMFRFAIEGITSFSVKPLNIAIYFGIFTSLFAFLFYVGYVSYTLYTGSEISGWASLISTVVFFGGLNLLVLGIIGIYLGKVFLQSKNRPNYIIRDSNLKK